jgi:hypothetical protein
LPLQGLDSCNPWDLDLVAQLFIKLSSRLDVLGLLVIWIDIDLESIEGLDTNVDVFGKAMDDSKTFRKRRAALELETLGQAV